MDPYVKIPVTLQPLIDATRQPRPTLLDQLKVGQVFQARVLDQPQTGLLRLQIATTQLLARSRAAIPTGTSLRLEVIKAGTLPELKVLRDIGPRELKQQVLRTAFARQMPPAEVRQAVTSLRAQAGSERTSEPLRQFNRITAASGVRIAPSSPPTLDAAQIRRAVQLSGVLHEARLAAGSPPPRGDAKTQLLQLLGLLRPELRLEAKGERAAPPPAEPGATQPGSGGDALLSRLIRLIEGSVTRIQLQQAAALPQEEGQRQAWQIDLPIHLPDETHDAILRIERDAATAGAEGDSWAVKLVFQFDSIGTLQCRIGLNSDRVSTTFWCERPATLGRVEQRLPSLRDALEAQGLKVVHIAGVLGEPAEPLIPVPIPDYLLDEHV